jgi:hypothetical protein
MTGEEIRTHILELGVTYLKDFGHADVNTENILTDPKYKKFFGELIEAERGSAKHIDDAIEELLEQINTSQK